MKFVASLVCSLLFSMEAVAQATGSTTDTVAASPTRTPAETHDTASAQKLEPIAIREQARTGSRYAPRLNSSALRTPTLLRDVPQSVSIVSSQLIKDYGMHSMSDVVAYLPGVTIGQGEGNRDHIVLRGNSSTADFFVDGVRDDVQYYRDIYNVDRVEALKGPNAMSFGRGGGGGVLNRIMKQAGWASMRELTAEGGAFGLRRISADMGNPVTSWLAARVPAVYQVAESFRQGVSLERYGVNPTVTLARPGSSTTLVLAYEHFRDHRTADRGIPSFDGRPLETARSTFFGDPAQSFSDARVNAVSATLSRMLPGGATFTNRTRLASYDKFYRNVFPGALDASKAQVTISAYDNSTDRRNLFNQTDIVVPARTGRARHLMLFGGELGRQTTDNFRTTGYFNGTSTSFAAAVTNPTISVPLVFRQGASDADNAVANSVLSVYAQDQIELSPFWQVVAGVRYEIFDIEYLDHRNGSALGRRDAMASPRIGLVYKPRDVVSLYGSFSVSHLPSSGDQFSSLTDVTSALRPERFTNYEVGAKWDLDNRFALSLAAYRLDRSNTRANDPVNPARTVQTGSQRTTGYELDLRGTVTSAWDVVAGVSRQNAFVSSTTASAREGASVPLVPRIAASIWNRYQMSKDWAIGAGLVHQARSYAGIDNTVTLPAFTRIDAAAFYSITPSIQAQINIENLFDAEYYPTANNNNNISPGGPRSLRFSLSAGF
ncbi:MAG: TonB-dependent siderophore receptor [Gemmatimonadaceae bacterium]|nr:TonB-dependent siderophore receptor [Gemmatimonadaceae bacterium]